MVKEKIDQLINDSAEKLGYMIYEFSVLLRGENSKILVKIDSLKGISHQDCENYSRELSNRLDESGILPNYSMEISSPGLKRKLRNIEEYKRFVGAPIKVIYKSEDTNRVLKGELINVDEDYIELKSENEEAKISLNNIVNSNLDY